MEQKSSLENKWNTSKNKLCKELKKILTEQWIFFKEKFKFFRENGSILEDQCTFHKEGPKLPRELKPFLGEQCTFFGERPQFSGEQSFFKLFPITITSCLFLYGLVTYHWKGRKKDYNFVIKNISIKIDMKKIKVIKFKHICSPKNMVVLQSNLRPFLPREHGCSLGQLRTFSP